MKHLDGIYRQVKTVLAKPENKKRIAWGTIFGIILGMMTTFLVNTSLPNQKIQAAPSQVVDGTSAYGTAFSMGRKVVRTNLGTNSNRVFTLVTTSNIAINLYYSDDAEAALPTWTDVGDINADTSTSAPNWEATDMVWDTVNNNLWIVYGCITIADSNAYDLKYRRVTAIGTTPSLGAETDAMSASSTLTYSHPAIAIMGDSGTSKVVFFASEHYNGLATRNIAMRTVTLDNVTLGTTRVLDTAWTANANSGILGVSRMNTDKNVLYYYNGTNMLATRHDDSSDVDATTGWDALNGTDASRTTISADDPTAPAVGSIAGDTDSDTVWFGWLDGAQDIGTCRWSTGTACDATAPAKITNAANTVGPALTTDGTTLYLIYTKNSDASILVYQSRTFSSGTGNWSGSETTIEDSAETSVTYPSISRNMYDGVIDVLFTTTTNYYIRHAMINMNSLPTLSISQPDGVGDTIAEDGSFDIVYSLADSDNTVVVDLYYDSNGSGLDGTAIAACQDKVQGSGFTCSWDTTDVTPGSYYIYGITKDPSHVQVTAYSSQPMAINDKPVLTITQPDGVGDTVTVGDHYNITYTLVDDDDVVTVAFYYDADGSDLDGMAITGACAIAAESASPATCDWNTTGMTVGTYYVYGKTTGDSINPQTTLYSSGMITINSANDTPDTPTNLGPAGYIDAAGWMNDNTPTFNFDITDPDPSEQVKYRIQIDDTAGFSSVIVDYQPSSFGAEGTYNYTVGQAGTYAVGSESMTLSDSSAGGGYYWRVKAIDDDLAESAYEEAGVDSTIDFRVDFNPPAGLAVYDGTEIGVDQDYSGTALNSLAANWAAANFDTSGPVTPNKYQYAIGTTVGGTEILTWTSTNTDGAVVTANSLTVNTGVMYFWTVKATDLAGNITTVSSNGQIIQPTLSFSVDSSTVTFAVGNPNWTDTKTTDITTQTNAKNGYNIQAYILPSELTSPFDTISNWSGTYLTPASWAGNCVVNSQCGFGYTSSDPNITTESRGNMYNNGANYCAYSPTSPGDVVADNNGPTIDGSRVLVNEVFTLTHKVSVNQNQTAGQYQTILMLMVTANY